ncbi:MAG: NADH-quinone oxidoreductase subunit E [Spirochaetes bacterium]|nr:NADH-quinone oxidoreductase subunit E [Spirochaetota bacterium]
MEGLDIKSLQEKFSLIFSIRDHNKILQSIVSKSPDEIITQITKSGLRGRGGAGFPTGIKWKAAQEVYANQKFVICNADEGEPGTFKDRKILQEHCELVLLGMCAAAKAIGATMGYIYLRGEYAFLKNLISEHINEYNNLFKKFSLNFAIYLRMGSGAYVCGEESALIESIEGNRGEPRNKPPFPVSKGLFNCPTVVNNVETLAYAAIIMDEGSAKFAAIGTKDSKGSKMFSISGDAKIKGVFELPLGMKVKELVDIFSDGDSKAVQIGGASGYCVARKQFEDRIIGYEGIPTGGSIIFFNSSRSMYRVLMNYLDFFKEESCGQCTPCRVGCQQLYYGIKAIRSGNKPIDYLNELQKLAQTMSITAKCGLGQSVANPFISITENFKEEICF